MNIKNLLKGLAFILVFLCLGFFALLYFHGFPNNVENYSPSNNKGKTSNEQIRLPEDNINKQYISVLDKPVKKNILLLNNELDHENSVSYISIDDSVLNTDLKLRLKDQAENLKLYGSFSKGKQTHEFKDTSYYKKRLQEIGSYSKIKEKLNFSPTELEKTLGSKFNLIGADYSGTYVENEGFDSVFRTYENTTDNSKIEINEMFINPANTRVDFYKENTNTYVNSNPATLEKIQTPDGYIYNLSWINNQRSFSLSSHGLTESQIMQFAQKISYN